MSLPRLVLCLSLLVSSLGFAQPPEEWTPYTQPAPETATPPPLVPAPTPPEARPPEQSPESAAPQDEVIPQSLAPRDLGTQSALRLMLTPWAGTVTGLAGLFIGVVPTALLALPFCLGTEGFEERRCAVPVVAGMALSYTVGVALGVTFVSGMMGGKGDGMTTFLGALAGAAAGCGIGVASQSLGAFILAVALGPLIGAVAGYEFSHHLNTRPEALAVQARSGFHVMPVVGATPRGGLLGGLAGRF